MKRSKNKVHNCSWLSDEFDQCKKVKAGKWTPEETKRAAFMRSNGKTYREIAVALGRTEDSVDHALRKIGGVKKPAKSLPSSSEEMSPRIVGVGDTLEVEAKTENIRTLEELIAACEIDLEKWRVERWIANTWPVGIKNDEGRIVTKNLYQVKANLIRRPVNKAMIKEIMEECLSTMDCEWPSPSPKKGAFKVLEVSIPDLHLGKLAWEDETGHDNYDSATAEKRFKDALEDLVSRTDPKTVAEIVLPLGNDFFNVNSQENTTAHGTPQHEDSRWQKSFRRGCQLCVWAIHRCSQIAPVKVIMVGGNHDIERLFYLGEFLSAFFRENEIVDIDNTPAPRKYYTIGNTLIGFTHGDRIKLKELSHLAQVECRDSWGKTKFCEWHLGHLHRESTLEEGGVTVRVIPSLTSPDAWHSQSGYVMANRAAQAFLYDIDTGLECIYYHRVV